MFKNRTIKIIFPCMLAATIFVWAFEARSQATTCESLFMIVDSTPVAFRTRIIPDIIVPAIQTFAAMKANTQPVDFEHFRSLQEASRMRMTSRPSNARKFNLDVDEPPRILSQQEKIIGAIRNSAQRELMKMEPLKFAFMSTQSARLERGDPITDVQFAAIANDPVRFAVIYALQSGLLARSGPLGDALTPKIPWARIDSMAHRAAFEDIVRLAKAMNDEPAAQVVAENMILETLRVSFVPQLAPAANQAAAAGTTGFPR